jgi:peptidoglycan endopeptidase LytE
MEYRSVGNRLAVSIDSLKLPTHKEETLSILTMEGFKVLEIDLVSLARKFVGVSKYRRGAKIAEAPGIFDCSSLIKWLYGQRGIWLPRRSIQQREIGERVEIDKIVSGDVVFVSGWIDYYLDNPDDGVGHVGIATENNTVIHACNSKVGIIETPLDEFADKNDFRGARRYIPKNHEIVTLETPPEREVEIADDIRWIVLQKIGK